MRLLNAILIVSSRQRRMESGALENRRWSAATQKLVMLPFTCRRSQEEAKSPL